MSVCWSMLLSACLLFWPGHAMWAENGQTIDLSDAKAVRTHRPFLVAHRGGVIAPNAPECSLAAIRLAAEHGYRMVELDVQEAKDGEPVAFHDWSLVRACGIDRTIRDFTASEVSTIAYRASDQNIAMLGEALALCASLNLWVMLDLKIQQEPPNTVLFFQRIGELVDEHGLSRMTVTISRHPIVREHLVGKVVFRVTQEEFDRVRGGESVPLNGKYWFGLPEWIPSEMVPKLQQNGAFVIAAINTARYPAHAHRVLALRDVERLLEAGVDGFQIDSVYEDFFRGKR